MQDVYTLEQIRAAVTAASANKNHLCAEILGALEEVMRVQETKELHRDHLGKAVLECLDDD